MKEGKTPKTADKESQVKGPLQSIFFFFVSFKKTSFCSFQFPYCFLTERQERAEGLAKESRGGVLCQ